MAQVLAPIVQTSGTITMIHSSADGYQNPSTTQPHQGRSSQMSRNQGYNGQSGGSGYRGTSGPIAPYAFSSTPQLRSENRSTSAPNPHSIPQINPARLGHPTHPSSSSDSTVSTAGSSKSSMAGPPFATKDDMVMASSDIRKSTVEAYAASPITLSASTPDLTLSLLDPPVKPSPGRYRRSVGRTESSNSVNASSTPTPTQQSPLIGTSTPIAASKTITVVAPELPSPPRPGHSRSSSVDDMAVARQNALEQAKRYRRRSLSGIDANAQTASAAPIEPLTNMAVPPVKRSSQEPRPTSSSNRHGSRPGSSQGHDRQGSTGSASSAGSNRPSSSRRDASPHRASAGSPTPSSRGNADAARRVMTPSPLSNPISPESSSPAKKASHAGPSPLSPAAQHLSALNDKEPGKGVKSRLRRAFSFGSAAELRRASAENSLSAERAKLRKDRYQNEYDAEQAAIVAKQEAAGIGSGIYSGQGGFTGSTDNLSISSTASSASIMLRKMGTGMKKGGRSIKGLFRPKSVIGVPAADGPVVQASVGQVSMVTVEAERQKVNVNADARDQVGGGTGYPRLERNSLDAGRATTNVAVSPSGSASDARKSIVGGERERAEVLSSIKKGILKRNGPGSDTSSTASRPTESSVSGTPNDDNRHAPIQVNGEDYFGRSQRVLSGSTRSLPNTPQALARNISFSPRLQFHDAWSSSDYDRRGEIATCNRLTPMLAQQIKEELNSFKMEMEVHEMSKPHTHFF